MSKKTTLENDLMIFKPKLSITIEEADEILDDTRNKMLEKYKDHNDFTKKIHKLFGSGEEFINKKRLEEEKIFNRVLKNLEKLKI